MHGIMSAAPLSAMNEIWASSRKYLAWFAISTVFVHGALTSFRDHRTLTTGSVTAAVRFMTTDICGSPPCDDLSSPTSRIARRLSNIALLFPLLMIASLGSGTASAQTPVSIFGSAIPTNAVEADFNAVTLGVKFWSSQAGTISAIRFYRGAKSPTGYVARLYSASGSILGTVTLLSKRSGPVPGWQTAIFPAPISISANTTYVAAYYTPNGQYADLYYGLNAGIVSGSLNVPASSTVGG